MTTVERAAPRLAGAAAVLFSVVYVVSDVIELAQGGFSAVQLLLTYAAEAAIPLFVPALWVAQRPAIGWLGLVGAVGYAHCYVYFCGTVLYSIVRRSRDWDELVAQVGPWMIGHGALMVVFGTCFGVAVARGGVLPRWTGWTLVAGVVAVAAANELPDGVRFVAATVRAAAFAGMGMALLRPGRPAPAVGPGGSQAP